jgi:hypothetical protein
MSKQKTPHTRFWNGDELKLVKIVSTWEEATHVMSALKHYFCDANLNGGFNVYVRIPKA